MTYDKPLAPKQIEFLLKSTKKWNIAHGSVRTGKTVCSLIRFMQACWQCPDNQLFMVGYTSDTIYDNAIRLLLESDQLSMFRPYLTWFAGKRELHFGDKVISTLGARDEGHLGKFQGLTMSVVYCDEATLYPTSILQMVDTRLSNPHSIGFMTCNPKQPKHILKEWIDKADAGSSDYYALHFVLDDNVFLTEDYKNRIKKSSTGVFYKRNVLGLWCLAEGAIFEFFDPKLHVVSRPPCAAEYWIAGIDYGTNNPFVCLLIGVSTGKYTQSGKKMWVEKEYYWDHKKKGRQKTNSELANDVEKFLEDYGVKHVYVDPSAASFKLELRRKGMSVIDANNEVEYGIQIMTDMMYKGDLVICQECHNTIREIEGYVWDQKKGEKGLDEPLKVDDHSVDAARYALSTHKVKTYDPYNDDDGKSKFRNRYDPFNRG